MHSFFMSNIGLINRISILIMFICIAASLCFFLLRKKGKVAFKDKENDLSRKIFGVYLPIVFLLAGVALRLWRFPNFPYGLSQDGVMSAVDAKALADYGTDRFGTWLPAHLQGWTYGQQSALMAYLLVPFVKLLGLNVLSLRLPTLILSVAGMVALYFAVRIFAGIKVSCMTAFLIAINPWHFIQSRWAIDCNIFPHVFILGFLLFIWGVYALKDGKGRARLYSSMLLFGLSMYGYGVSFFFVPFFLLGACIYLLVSKRIKVRDVVLCIVFYFLISWPEYTVMAINYLKLPTIELPFVTLQYFPESVRSNDLLIFSDHFFAQLKENIGYMLDVCIFQRNQNSWDVFKEFGSAYKCSLLFAGLGVVISFVRAFAKKENNACYHVVNIYFGACILLCVLVNGINIPRSNVLQYVYVIYCALGIAFVFDNIKNFAVIIPAVYLVLSVGFVNEFYAGGEARISAYLFDGYVEALECAKEYKGTRYYITPSTQYDEAYTTSEIIAMFVFDIDSKYQRGEVSEWKGYTTPYADTFVYRNLSGTSELCPGDVVIFRDYEGTDALFDENLCVISRFKGYGVATLKEGVASE